MTASRLSSTGDALGATLDALADALAQARHEEFAASEPNLGDRVRAFRDAAAAAAASGESLAPAQLHAITAALQRCRRLGASLTSLTATGRPPVDSPHGYSPVGQPVSPAGEGAFLTARG